MLISILKAGKIYDQIIDDRWDGEWEGPMNESLEEGEEEYPNEVSLGAVTLNINWEDEFANAYFDPETWDDQNKAESDVRLFMAGQNDIIAEDIEEFFDNVGFSIDYESMSIDFDEREIIVTFNINPNGNNNPGPDEDEFPERGYANLAHEQLRKHQPKNF